MTLLTKKSFSVYHVITKLDLGGAERVAINIAKSDNIDFHHHIFEVVKGDSHFTENIIEELTYNNVHFHKSRIKNKIIAILFFPFWFLFFFKKTTPVIVHSHTEIPDVAVLLFMKSFGRFFKGIYCARTIHNYQLWNGWKKTGKYVDRFFNSKNANIAISKSTKFSYEQLYPQETVPIIYNGVDNLNEKGFKFLKREKLNILFAGRFEYQKGVKELCEVIKGLERNELFHFHIIGDGSMKGYIESTLLSTTNFTLYDKIFNLSQYFCSFDYVFMPSNFEGLGLIAIEASLHKTPVIINSTTGLLEVFPVDWPLRVDMNSVTDFLALFNKVVPGVNRNELGELIYNHVKDTYSVLLMQKKYESFYLNLIQA